MLLLRKTDGFLIGWISILLLVGGFRCSAVLVLSEPTNDVYIGVCGSSSVNFQDTNWITNNTPIRYDDTLSIILFCRTGAVNLLAPVNKRVFIDFQVRDINGKVVKKTSEGSLWGSDLEHFPKKPGMNNHDRMVSLRTKGPHTDGLSAFVTGLWAPAPKDLFEITNSGIYNLTLEVHLMKQHMIPGGWTWDHIAIPPVTTPIIKQ